MTSIAFTGPTVVGSQARETIVRAVETCDDATEFVSGAARGVDTLAAEVAHVLYPRARHVLVVPQAPYNRDALTYAEAFGFEVVKLSLDGPTDRASAYRRRNFYMVQRADHLLAFPHSRVEERRSGTWMTIRLARRAHVPVQVVPLWTG